MIAGDRLIQVDYTTLTVSASQIPFCLCLFRYSHHDINPGRSHLKANQEPKTATECENIKCQNMKKKKKKKLNLSLKIKNTDLRFDDKDGHQDETLT